MSLMCFKSKFDCVVLSFIFLLQSCAIYQKTPISITDATATNNKVLIIKTNDTKLRLNKIELIDGKYYGIIEGDDRQIVQVPLNERDIKTIRVLDKTASTWGTIGILAGTLFILFGIFAASEVQSMNF